MRDVGKFWKQDSRGIIGIWLRREEESGSKFLHWAPRNTPRWALELAQAPDPRPRVSLEAQMQNAAPNWSAGQESSWGAVRPPGAHPEPTHLFQRNAKRLSLKESLCRWHHQTQLRTGCCLVFKAEGQRCNCRVMMRPCPQALTYTWPSDAGTQLILHLPMRILAREWRNGSKQEQRICEYWHLKVHPNTQSGPHLMPL